MRGKRGPKAEALAESRRWEILGAAVERFSWNGYTSTTISEIAERAGLSHGLVHHYFATKADLYHACIQAALDYIVAARRTALEGGSTPEAKLRRWAYGLSLSMTDAFLSSRLVMQVLGAPGCHPTASGIALEQYRIDEGGIIIPLLLSLGYGEGEAQDRYWMAFAGIFGARSMGMWQQDPTPLIRLIYRQACFTLGIDPDPEPDMQLPPIPWPQDITRTPWCQPWGGES